MAAGLGCRKQRKQVRAVGANGCCTAREPARGPSRPGEKRFSGNRSEVIPIGGGGGAPIAETQLGAPREVHFIGREARSARTAILIPLHQDPAGPGRPPLPPVRTDANG